jgi:hypothetical protein
MQRKYKVYLFAWIIGLSAVDGAIGTLLLIKNLDKQLLVGGIVFIVHTTIQCIGSFLIAKRAKLERIKESGQ